MILQNVWQEFLNIIKEEVGSRVVETWFKSVTFSHWDSYTKTAYLQTPNSFIKDWLVSNYQKLLKLHLGRLLHETEFRLIFLDETQQSTQPTVVVESVTMPTLNPAQPRVMAETTALRTQQNKTYTYQQYRFENFIVGEHNELAYAAAQAVCSSPGNLYNPFIIYGQSGLGKTHIAHAIAYQIKANDSNKKVLFQSADRFVNEFIHAVRFDKVAHFDHKYKNIDVLIIDDIHYIANKEQTQEAFFHLFNNLYESRKQIVCTAPCLPSEIKGISERLLSRLQSGLITDIAAPDVAAKASIIALKAKMHNMQVPQDVIQTIAAQSGKNIRDIEGMLIRVLAFSSLTKQPLTVELVQKLNKGQIATTEKPTKPDLQRIALKVSQHYQCPLEEMRSSKRHRHIALARHVAMYFMKKLTEKSLADIALFLKRKDHTTVIHAVQKIEQHKQVNAEFSMQLTIIERLLS